MFTHKKLTSYAGVVAGILTLLVIISIPVIIWHSQGEHQQDVYIIDKTVPDQSYREHRGLTWLLNYEKWVKEDGAYDASKDYTGFHPGEEREYAISSFPDTLKDYELIYLADSYGVYEDEYYGGTTNGDRSASLYGGMQVDEVNKIAEAVQKGSTFIAEFNAFGSPTEQAARERLYSVLNLEWSGWIGRYFEELEVGGEVPAWAVKNYEKQTGEKWKFEGDGLLLVDEDDQLIVIEGEEIGEDTVTFSFTENGKDHVSDHLVQESSSYHYWFDIVTPENDEEILATYSLDVTEEVEKTLSQSGVPVTFPAVINHQDTYYFAGDYADRSSTFDFYQYKGIPSINRLLTFGDNSSIDAFYWKMYVPMMKSVLEEVEEKTSDKEEVQHKSEVYTSDGVRVAGQVSDDHIQLYRDGKWEDMLIKGVNMGIAKPGYFPGETAITKREYKRWFRQISDMNANAVRVYTIHPPGFYEALLEHNKETEEPLYLFHGVWVEEEPMLESQNAFAEENLELLDRAIEDTIDIIHGNARIENRKGHAGGIYSADVSPYVIGWILGVEWDPEVVVSTNEKNASLAQYDGDYVSTSNASPFEIWLANMMDKTMRYEMENYQWQRPVSFTNWVTTDLIEHPAEPLEKEDLVSVNPNAIELKETYQAGQFASYHIYPYYPDFLNYEEKYVNYKDHNGEKNNYAGYLNDLRGEHSMPVLVAEFGVPASRGITHRNVYGMDQGGHSESEQGEIDAKLFESIVEEDYAGGLIFSWQDEWFKRTWNTMDYDNPDRRPFWSNDQTNEQQFGLLSFDPGETLKVKVDGDVTDWEDAGIKPLVTSDNGNFEKLYMTSDEKYIYFRLDYENMTPELLEEEHTALLFNTIGQQGSTALSESLAASEGIDYILNLNGKTNSRLLVHSYYDTFYYQYGESLGLIDKNEYASDPNNEVFHPLRLALNKELYIPTEDKVYPFEDYEAGLLTYGNGDPEDKKYNSVSDFIMKDNRIEIRLPWALFNVKDPSKKEIFGDIFEKGLKSSRVSEGFEIGVVTYEGEVENEGLKIQTISQTEPKLDDETLTVSEFAQFEWDEWDEPTYHERLKQSYYIIQEAFGRYKK
ncbi:hypothetical protein [Alkalihalobacillus sp. CinArs1]|uniref:hypothetical protein n=1 Tax=Alkalihalobacillus sp. CinArs1 TaxID=2995314 RepID=UPI0022DE89FE|nr:hypothetical protein [Alkalihalobacillus sp. CinArs1]